MAFELVYYKTKDLDDRTFDTRTVNWESNADTWDQLSQFKLVYYERKS